MKHVDKFTYLISAISICFTFLLGYIVQQSYYNSQFGIYKKMEMAFRDAIGEKIEILYATEHITTYIDSYDTDTVPTIERQLHCDLEYIIQYASDRYSLDSLFQLKLAEHQIQARSAVRCISRFGVLNSSSDSLFYEQSVKLPPVIFRPHSKSMKKPVELQAYVQIPFLFVLKQISTLGFMLFLWMLINGILWGVYFFWPRYRYRMLANNRTVEIQTVVEEKIVEVQKFIPVQSFTKKNIFPNGFQFDKNTGRMVYNEQTIKLTKQSLKLFCYFLDVKQSMLTYKDIGKFLFNLDGDDPKVQSRTSTTITRLRESLISFPFIQIEAIRGIGYQLHIDCSEIVETDVAKPDNTDVV